MEAGIVVGYDQIAYRVIIRFLSRTAWIPMEEIKQVQLLEERPAQLQKEDLAVDDRETRSKLWLAVKEARNRGDKVYYVGNAAYINGNEIKI